MTPANTNFKPETSPKTGRVVSQPNHQYQDPNGKTCLGVTRSGGVAECLRPTQSGGWSTDLKNVQAVPYGARELACSAPGSVIVIAKDEADAETLRSLGYTASCAPPLSTWLDTDWEVYVAGRHVVVIGVRDDAGRRNSLALARAIEAFAASVRIAEPTQLVPNQPMSDWIMSWAGTDGYENAGVMLLKATVDAAQPPEPDESMSGSPPPAFRVISADERQDAVKPNESVDDPHRLARVFIESECTHPDGLTLRYHQGEFLEWNRAYVPVLPQVVRARITAAAKAEYDRENLVELAQWEQDQADRKGKPKPKVRKVTGAAVGNVMLAASSYTLTPSGVVQPCWLTDSPPFPASDVLPTRNCLVNLPGLVAGDRQTIHPPTPLFFAGYCLDVDFDPEAPLPVNWLTFLGSLPVEPGGRVQEQLWPNDLESIETLQEWFGLLLTPDTTHQKILMMIGPKRSGKGTIARILREMIGPQNTANPTLASLGTNFGMAPLIGKPAAVITDARLSGRADIAQVVERLLNVSGEDSQTIDRKHQPSWTGKLSTRFMLISNEVPRLSDTSGALASRMVLLRLTQSFFGKEDRSLTNLLLGEMPGILLWAIEGWKRLRERGHFRQPASGLAMIEKLEELASPVGAFLKEQCQLVPDGEVPCPTLYEAWRRWCSERGKEWVGDEMAFGRDLHAVIPHLETANRRIPGGGGKRQRFYRGLILATDFSG